jgi:LacI family transcriptional regulator
MVARKQRSADPWPHVALIVETSLEPGRGMLRGIGEYLRAHGPWSVYYEPRGLDDRPPAWLRTWRGHGIIARLSSPSITHAVLETGVPVVDTLGMLAPSGVSRVVADDQAIGRLGAEHLLERGFRHFAFCGTRTDWSRRTGAAFAAVVNACGRECQAYELPLHNRAQQSWEADQEQLTRWLQRLPKPVAIMACSDPRAQRVLEACRRAGLVVPDEVALVGVGNDPTMCALCDPPLSSVIAGHRQIGYQAAALLDRLMQGTARPQTLCLEPLGVVTRQSTDVTALDDADITAAVRFIRQHAAQRIQVDDVARHCLLSRSELKRRFRRLLGRSVHEQIVRERLAQAERLLAETEMSIAEIARRAGFGRRERMGDAFRAKRGTTPAQYRKRFRASQ